MFQQAKAVFIQGKAREVNWTAGFICRVTARPGAAYVLRLAASTLCRVMLDGEFLHYGPARGPHGWVRVDEVPLSLTAGEHILAFEVAGYYCPCFYTLRLPSFLQAEILENGEAAWFTGRDFQGASLTDYREQVVPRYSYQRPFTEVYDLDCKNARWFTGAIQPEALETVAHGCGFLPRGFARPTFDLTSPAAFVRAGVYRLRHQPFTQKARYLEPAIVGTAFPYESCPNDIVDSVEGDFEDIPGLDSHLFPGQFAQYAFDKVNTGFIRTRLRVLCPAVVYVIFGEKLEGRDIFWGNVRKDQCATMNVIKYTLPKGAYTLESFEAYSLRYVGLMVEKGEMVLEEFSLREYSYPIPYHKPSTGDRTLDAVLDACYEGFRQNTVDCFMDCPGRERGGWLCDSYFTAQASLLFTGSLQAEQAFLDNFRLASHFPLLPEGLLPMCYPGDMVRETTIPQWTLWFVAQLHDFGKRGGDTGPFEALVDKILGFFAGYENEDGLLENLPYWNFVEWTRANQWTQDVNYPTNMLYARVLSCAAEMFDRPLLAQKSAQIRETIIAQSFDGRFFRDHGVRRDGKLVVLEDKSAICQHEAFLFGIADSSARFVPLKQAIIRQMGVDASGEGLPEGLEPLDLFIGFAVRVEVLMQFGCYERNLREIKLLYGPMAEETGTLWEHRSGIASRNHGFGSFVAVKIAQCLAQGGQSEGKV